VPTVTRVELTPKPPGRARAVLGLVALACALVYGTLLIVERRMTTAPGLPVVSLSQPIELVESETPAMSVATDADSREQMVKVVDALTWLGTHSLNEYRLTAPPKDNAFYYFTRLGQLDPGNEAARRAAYNYGPVPDATRGAAGWTARMRQRRTYAPAFVKSRTALAILVWL
jgi:hypothetical protein